MKDHQLIKGSATNLSQILDNSIDMGLTSPPYNELKPYGNNSQNSDSQDWDVYYSEKKTIFSEYYRVMKPGARLLINVANLGRFKNISDEVKDYYKPLDLFITVMCLEVGFIHNGVIVWEKVGGNLPTAWGSFESAAGPVMRDIHEWILIFSKPDSNNNKISLEIPEGQNSKNIPKDEFLKRTTSIWKIAAASNKEHPCVFPLELAEKAIRLFTFETQVVLDTFAGSGTVAQACLNQNRKSISVEIEPKYWKLIERITAQTMLKDWFFELANPREIKGAN